MLHFPLHVLPPGLLAHPATPSTAFDHLKGRQIARVIVDGHESAGGEQLKDAVWLDTWQAPQMWAMGCPVALAGAGGLMG